MSCRAVARRFSTYLGTMAFWGVAVLSARVFLMAGCRVLSPTPLPAGEPGRGTAKDGDALSPVEQTLGELARAVRALPSCSGLDRAFTVAAAAQSLEGRVQRRSKDRYSVRGFLLPHADGCTEMGCDGADRCCNGCEIGWSLSEYPFAGLQFFVCS